MSLIACVDGEVSRQVLRFLVLAWFGERVTYKRDLLEVDVGFEDFVDFGDDLREVTECACSGPSHGDDGHRQVHGVLPRQRAVEGIRFVLVKFAQILRHLAILQLVRSMRLYFDQPTK